MGKVDNRFTVKPFKNPSGETVFRVEGSLDGKRIRKNRQTLAEAQGLADRLELKAAEQDGRRSYQSTTLTANQIRIAELLFESAQSDESVLAMVGQAGTRVESIPLKTAVSRYLHALEKLGRRAVTVETLGYVLNAFLRDLPITHTGELTKEAVEGFILAPGYKPDTQIDRKKRLSQFLAYSKEQGWVANNWAGSLPKIHAARELPAILSVDELTAFIHAARDHEKKNTANPPAPIPGTRGEMLGYALCAAFTGLRPQEARQIAPAEFHLDGELDCIEVSPRIAKVNLCRQVEVLPELIPHLKKCITTARRRKLPPAFHAKRHFDLIREAAGVKELWQNDILRHTYASFHYAVFKDAPRLVYAMGNSENILHRNYIRPMTARTGQKYIDILSGL